MKYKTFVIAIEDKELEKLKPEEYDQYVLPKSTRDFLSDEDRILRWLRAKYGNYYTFFL
jgi:hypothetical protein